MKPSKINEWIKEVEERPLMAPFIIRRISERLFNLDAEIEELRAENLALESGKKTQDYERKITELEYQLKLLKRQVQNGVEQKIASARLLAYHSSGEVLIRDLRVTDLVSGEFLQPFRFEQPLNAENVRLLVVEPTEEILFLFDSGRVQTMSADKLPVKNENEEREVGVFQSDMRSGERLIALIPLSKAPLIDLCIQISRRGLAKSFAASYFRKFVSNRNLGTGVRSKSDRNFNLTICKKEDIFVVISNEGYLAGFTTNQFSVTAKEMLKLGMNDYLVASFVINEEASLIVASENGDLFIQPPGWMNADNASGSKRRLLLSKGKTGGVQVIGGEALKLPGWGFLLYEDGQVRAVQLDESIKNTAKDKGKSSKDDPKALAFTATDLFSME